MKTLCILLGTLALTSALPATAGQAPGYRSALADYRPYRQPEALDWRQANEQVQGQAGHAGHGGHVMSHDGHDMRDMPKDKGGQGMPEHSGHGGH